MKIERVKVTDLQTLQLEKQRLAMKIAYTEEQIVEKVSSAAYELPVQLVTYILPFGLGEKRSVVNGVKKVRSFISDNLLGGKQESTKSEIYKVLFVAGKTLLAKILAGKAKAKSS